MTATPRDGNFYAARISADPTTTDRTNSQPGTICETLSDGLPVLHIERIKFAAAIEVAAKDRFSPA